MKRRVKIICTAIMAIALLGATMIVLWWYGAFLPAWIDWKEVATDYSDGYVVLKDRKVRLYSDTSCKTVLWSSERDWFVQNVVIKDLDQDGVEEIIMLVWKHGSYGKHRPFWVEKNDIRLKQHIFIYSNSPSKKTRLFARWMSSELGFEVESIASGQGDGLIVTVRSERSMLWKWHGFGIKPISDTKASEIKLMCAGDNLIHVSLIRNDRTGAGLYEKISQVIQKADIAAINLESMLVDDDNEISDFPRFGTPVGVGNSLLDAGFDVIGLANNHVLDKGKYGVDTTIDFFSEKQIPCFGACGSKEYTGDYKDSVAFVEKAGIRVAFLGFTYGTNQLACPKGYPYMVEKFDDRERMLRQIDYARGRADIVVVYAHWGDEYATEPNEEQQELARIMAEHKVDVIIGSHPHVIQKYDIIKDRKSGHKTIVYYSLGNFISGQTKEGTQEGMLAELSISKDEKGNVKINNYTGRKIKTVCVDKQYWVEEE